MSNVYDENLESVHGPSGKEKFHHGPYGGKNNQHQLSVEFSGEKRVKPIPKPKRTVH